MNTNHKVLEAALSKYAEKEIVGKSHNPIIVGWLKSLASWVHDDETSWCAAFVNIVLKEVGLIGTGKLNARSFLYYGDPTNTPSIGDVVVFWRDSPSSWKGHVAFFIREKDGFIYVLGGNQSNQVSIAAYPKTRLLEYRKHKS